MLPTEPLTWIAVKKPMLQNRMYARCNKDEYAYAAKLEALVFELGDELEE